MKGYFWTSTQDGDIQARHRSVEYNSVNVPFGIWGKVIGISVRCVKDTLDAINQPPEVPSEPNPADNSTNQNINIQLSWTCSDPDSDPLTYDVYFSTLDPPAQVVSGLSTTTYDPGSLILGTIYYWKIIAHDDHNNHTAGPVWSFSTLSAGLPVVTTAAVSNISPTAAVSGGNVVNDGGGTITARGVCWSTSTNPTVSDDHTLDGTGTGSFTSSLTGLSASTLYYVRAYATNIAGTAYGDEVSFTTLFNCGTTLSVNHVSGLVAPVSKSVSYGTVNNIPGELTKCWITSNLGADYQATAVNEATEPPAGWYWQFNRKQGYKHDGTNRTPNTTWIANIDESGPWQLSTDPCRIELGSN
jgi:hypothetical protein